MATRKMHKKLQKQMKNTKKQDSWETARNPNGFGGCVQRESAAGQILETEVKPNPIPMRNENGNKTHQFRREVKY